MGGQSSFLQALGWAVLNSLWQMALLWVLFHLITSLFKIAKPSQKNSLASLMLMTGFAWFLYTLGSIWTNPSASPVVSSGIVNITGNENLNKWLHSTLPVASIIYLILLILPALHFFRNYRYVRIIRMYGLEKIDVQWRIFVKNVSARMGIKKPVHIWVSELVSSPVTIGYLKPIILVPLAAINHLTPQQLEAVLLHELSHIRRHDYLINIIINFIQTILYFNPFVKAFVKTVEREREKSCDEMVMQFQYDPHGYASALLLLEKANHLSRPLAVAAAGKKNDLLHRIELILGIYKKPVISFNRLAGLFAGLLCVIALNALLIFSKPEKDNEAVAFTHLSSPFFFFTGDNTSPVTPITAADKQTSPAVTSLKETFADAEKIRAVVHPSANQANTYYNYNNNEAAPLIVNVNYKPIVEVPQLKSYQEDQVKETIDASKKVLEEGQWKAVEKNIADALTTYEKANLKSAYQKEFDKVDLTKWEDKLRLSYNLMDWDRINEQLGKAVYEIKLDSLQKVYHDAVTGLITLEQQMNECNEKGIPDTDITLQLVEQRKQQAQNVLNNLKAIRSKKIIHL